jgi:hypothetical protein
MIVSGVGAVDLPCEGEWCCLSRRTLFAAPGFTGHAKNEWSHSWVVMPVGRRPGEVNAKQDSSRLRSV